MIKENVDTKESQTKEAKDNSGKGAEVEKCGVWRVEKELGGWTEKKSGREKDEEGEHQTPAGLIHLSPLPSPQVPWRTVDPGKEIRNGAQCAQCHFDGKVLSVDTPVLQKICLRGDPDKQFWEITNSTLSQPVWLQ